MGSMLNASPELIGLSSITEAGISAAQGASAARQHALGSAVDFHAHAAQLDNNRLQILEGAVAQQQFAAGNASSNQKCSGLDAVGHDGVLAIVQ